MIFSSTEEQQIISAIREAERHSTGEIRLFVEAICPSDAPLERAASLFAHHGMTETAQRNGVLLYLAWQSRQFAIWGDTGIHERAGQQFWEEEKQILRQFMQQDRACEGVCAVIAKIGAALDRFFPAGQERNINELPDDILYG